MEKHTCEDDAEFLPPLCAPEASIESQEKKRTKVGYKQDWSPVTEIMVRYDISAEAGQELLKGFAKVPEAKITSTPSKTLLHTSKAKTICGRRDTSVKMMKKKPEFYVYQFDGKEHSEVVLVSYVDGDIVKRKPLEVFKYN